MLRKNDIMKYVEKYRNENKITILGLTKGIMSTRNYSRLLTGETVLSFEDYSALLKRLRVPLFEFSIYLYNCRFFEFIHEIQFQQAVDDKKYEEAYQMITPYLENQNWGSIFADKTLPMALKYVEYQLNKCSHAELIVYARGLVNLDYLLECTILTLDDFEALFLFSSFCSIEERRIISKLLNTIIIENKIKILNASVEHTTSRLHRLAIQLLTSFDDNDEHDIQTLKQIANIALEYQSRAKIYGEDLYLLNLLFTYDRRHNLQSNNVLTEFILSALGSNEEHIISDLKQRLTFNEINDVLELIKTNRLRKINLFESEISHELI